MAEPISDERLKTALARFKLVNDAESTQRQAELDDLKFVDLEEQWDETVKAQRAGGATITGQPPVPARPCLTFNLLKQPAQLLANQQRSAKLSLTFSPKGSGAKKETAEVYEDIVRAIQADSRAGLARSWAYTRASKCGRGYYRWVTEYANDEDDEQDLVCKRILNQASVYFDPYAQEPDWSDARFCLITQDMPFSEYKAQFPQSKVASMQDSELVGIGDDVPGWIGGDSDETRTVRVAEYFYIEEKTEKTLTTGTQREIKRRQVMWCRINCCEMLDEPVRFLGKYIPIVPVIADEFNVDGKRVWQGIVRSAKDGNRLYNFMESALAEGVGLAPRAPWIVAEGQLEGYELQWQQANVRNFPYLQYKMTTLGGEQAPPPQRNAIEPPIQAMAFAANEGKENVKITTGVFDPSLGQLSPGERSGKAVLALQKQSEMASSGYLANLAEMSMVLEGKMVRAIIAELYNDPGRIAATIGADDKRGSVIIGVPYTVEKGEPIPVPNWQEGMPIPDGAKYVDLKKGEYTVAATVGKSHTTRREEGVSAMSELATAAPQLVPRYADVWIENMDFPGARQVADRVRPPDAETGKDIPPAIQQQMQQMEQVIQALSGELKKKTEVIETEAVKAQQSLLLEQQKQAGETERSQLESQTKIRIAEMQANTQFGVAELKAGLDTAKLRLAHIEELMGHQAEARQIESEHAHDAQQMDQNRQAQAQGAEADRQFQREEGDKGRQQERELTGAQLAVQRETAAMKPQAGA